jgi:hypothetical protein
MAALDPARKKAWKAALASTTAPWIVCGIAPNKESVLDGMTGLIDWMAHGQVSRLLQRGQLAPADATVLPGDPKCHRPSVLLFPVAEGASALNKKLKSLGVKELALAESTFPEDFLGKLKQTLSKEGIRCTTLESLSEPS